MADTRQVLHITPRVLDFGGRIVALHHVTSVAIRRSRPFFALGLVLMLAGAGFVGFEIWQRGFGELLKGGSTPLWLALVAVGIGIFAQIYQRRGLVISLSDRTQIPLEANREDFCQNLLTRFSEAIKARPDAPLHYVVDVGAQTIEIASDSDGPPFPGTTAVLPAAPPQDRRPPDARLPGSPPANWSQAAGKPPAAMPLPHERPPASDMPFSSANPLRPAAGAPTGAAPPLGQASRPPNGGAATAEWSQQSAKPARPTYVNGNGNGHTPPATGVLRPLTPTPLSNPAQDIDQLMELVRRADVQHKDALLNLLGVVDDYVKGGATMQEDAVEHWQSFASYVHQYLADVDGLVPLTERAGRRFEQR